MLDILKASYLSALNLAFTVTAKFNPHQICELNLAL